MVKEIEKSSAKGRSNNTYRCNWAGFLPRKATVADDKKQKQTIIDIPHLNNPFLVGALAGASDARSHRNSYTRSARAQKTRCFSKENCKILISYMFARLSNEINRTHTTYGSCQSRLFETRHMWSKRSQQNQLVEVVRLGHKFANCPPKP